MTASYFFPRVISDNSFFPLTRSESLDPFFNSSFPWKILQQTKEESKRLEQFLPKLDVLSDDKNYFVHVEIPGINCDDVKLEVKDRLLTLSGEKKNEKVEGDKKEHYVSERSWGSFYRELMLPDDADVDNITATHKNGVLSINIPKIVSKESIKNININRS